MDEYNTVVGDSADASFNYWGLITEVAIMTKLNDPAKLHFNVLPFFVSKIDTIGIKV